MTNTTHKRGQADMNPLTQTAGAQLSLTTEESIIRAVALLEQALPGISTVAQAEDALATIDAISAAAKRKKLDAIAARLSVSMRRVERRLGELLPRRSTGPGGGLLHACNKLRPDQRSKYRAIASIPDAEFEELAIEAITEKQPLTFNRVINIAKTHRRRQDIKNQEMALSTARPDAPLGLFHVIVVDPPLAV